MRCSPGRRRGQRQQVRVGEVGDVHVVADAGAVRRRVVLAVDGDRLPLSGGDLQRDRDEVRLGGVPLAEAEGRAGDVEVPQAHRGEAVRDRVRGEHVRRRRAWWRRRCWSAGWARPRGSAPTRARRRWPRWRRRRSAGSRRRASPRAAPASRRRWCASTSSGCCCDAPTRLLAAKCSTASGRDVGQHRRRVVQRGLDERGARRGRRRACPVDRSSSTVTSWPSASRAAVTTLPM